VFLLVPYELAEDRNGSPRLAVTDLQLINESLCEANSNFVGRNFCRRTCRQKFGLKGTERFSRMTAVENLKDIALETS
jgi:hypothetical protein